MSSIVIAGDTSGSVTLQAPATAGTTVLTLPSTSGTLAIGSGAFVLLSTVTASASATVDVETTFSSTYDAYMLVVSGARPDTDSVSLLARMKIGGSYITTSTYVYLVGYTSTSGNASSTLATEIEIIPSVYLGSDAASSGNVVMYIFNPSSTAFKKQIRFEASSIRISSGNTQLGSFSGSASNNGTAALTGIRFYASSGNITEGKFRLYGLANS
jgi:hypothetical protein